MKVLPRGAKSSGKPSNPTPSPNCLSINASLRCNFWFLSFRTNLTIHQRDSLIFEVAVEPIRNPIRCTVSKSTRIIRFSQTLHTLPFPRTLLLTKQATEKQEAWNTIFFDFFFMCHFASPNHFLRTIQCLISCQYS